MPEGTTPPGPDAGQPLTPPAVSMSVVAAYVAALDLASDVDLATMLQRLVDLARSVVPSQYAAIGVSDECGHITEFITSGITLQQRALIGNIPQGHGLLGVLIRDRTPLRVPDMSADPRSVGFPVNHPPMRSLLGVPILLGDRVLGNLYLTERLGGEDYDANDLQAVQILAAHAARAIDRAQLYDQAEVNRRRAEEQLNQLQVILDSLPSGVMIYSSGELATEVVNATGRQMLGMDPGTQLDPAAPYGFERTDGRTLAREQWPSTRALQGELVRNRQLTLRLKDGKRLPVLVQAVPLRNSFGEVVRAVVVIQDVTRMREAEQLKDDFLSLISHEFRTPLTAIHGGAALLASRGESLDPGTRRDLLADIVTESATLDQMLSNMLTLVSIQAGRFEATTEPTLVSALINQAIDTAKSRDPHHAFVVDHDRTSPPAESDPDLLLQVLRNLYENAAKYSQAGTTIYTHVSHDQSSVVIHIRDQGSGIASEHLDSVFERFRRPGADPTIRGMGLGLYLSKHLMQAQGGEISVHSEGIGRGSTFAATLPMSRDWIPGEAEDANA